MLFPEHQDALAKWTLRQSVHLRNARTRVTQFLERLFSSDWRTQATLAASVMLSIFLSAGNALGLWWFGAKGQAVWIASIMTFPIALISIRILWSPELSFKAAAILGIPFLALLHVPIWTALWLAPSYRVIALDLFSEWGGFTFQAPNILGSLLALFLADVCFLLVLSVALFVILGFESLLERIAKYPKGPLLAASLIFTTFATLLKYWTGGG